MILLVAFLVVYGRLTTNDYEVSIHKQRHRVTGSFLRPLHLLLVAAQAKGRCARVHFYLSPLKLELSIHKLDNGAILHRDLFLFEALDNIDDVEIVEEVLVSILTTKQVNLILYNLRRVAVPTRRDVALLLAFKPLEHFELASRSLEVGRVADVTFLVIFDLALCLI